MNASATIRSAYVRASVFNLRPIAVGTSVTTVTDLEARPANPSRLQDFKPVNYLEHVEVCKQERNVHVSTDPEKGLTTSESMEVGPSFVLYDETFKMRIRKMFTVFPYRDPIYLVAFVFLIGSADLVMNAFFDLLPRTIPSSAFENEESIAVPVTVLLGALFFFAAGIFDVFGALNADNGRLETEKIDPQNGKVTFKPALLGTPEFKWRPSREKFLDLMTTNLAFQAGVVVLFGGVLFLFAGVVDFHGIVSEESKFHGTVVFGPQVVHGFLFLIANAMLALSEQTSWLKPKLWNADWQGAFLNAVGGFWFMMAGFFSIGEDELGAAICAMIGSWAFLLGSLVRFYVAMEFAG